LLCSRVVDHRFLVFDLSPMTASAGGEGEGEYGSALLRVGGFEVAVLRSGEGAGDGESEARSTASALRGVGEVIAFEEPGERRRDTWAGRGNSG
jgi:hypothetical protein